MLLPTKSEEVTELNWTLSVVLTACPIEIVWVISVEPSNENPSFVSVTPVPELKVNELDKVTDGDGLEPNVATAPCISDTPVICSIVEGTDKAVSVPTITWLGVV